jgi:uridine kinase
LAIGLCRKYPDSFALVHLDDYFKPKEIAPAAHGFTNWDHPDAVRFDDLLRDLLALQNGRPISVITKSELYNPDYNPELRNKIEYTIKPRPAVVVEGHLLFQDRRIRELMDLKIFLEAPIEETHKRQSSNRRNFGPVYCNNVLIPMYKKFVEPTKQYADIILPVAGRHRNEVLAMVEPKIISL